MCGVKRVEIQAAKQVTVYTWIAVIVFALFLMLCVPLFIRMPLATDVVLYDLQAQTALSGGTLYQDVFETNLP